jgi:hypothetical protein
MGCYLEDYRTRVGSWAGKFSWYGVPKRGNAKRTTGDCLELTVLRAMVLAVSLIYGWN